MPGSTAWKRMWRKLQRLTWEWHLETFKSFLFFLFSFLRGGMHPDERVYKPNRRLTCTPRRAGCPGLYGRFPRSLPPVSPWAGRRPAPCTAAPCCWGGSCSAGSWCPLGPRGACPRTLNTCPASPWAAHRGETSVKVWHRRNTWSHRCKREELDRLRSKQVCVEIKKKKNQNTKNLTAIYNITIVIWQSAIFPHPLNLTRTGNPGREHSALCIDSKVYSFYCSSSQKVKFVLASCIRV